jgi:hypothetical protein
VGIEYKAWQDAEAAVAKAVAGEKAAYAAFRKNLNKRKDWRSAEWLVVIAREEAERKFEAYLNA